MATIVKDLGAVTAYAYAKEKGYTGTEDEFAELMASYADVAEQAAESAAQAGASAEAAEQAKAEAVLSASAAASSASTASTKASEAAQSASSASGSANTATTKANEASTSATNAASSASAAATSATNAGASATAAASSATAASNAQTAAETAQGKAEDAQTAAEDAAEQAGIYAAGYLKAFPVDTASGSIASFPDGADELPVKDLTVAVEPVQGLHGYDSPWPAGGGVNKANLAGATSDNITYGLTTSFDLENEIITISGEFTATTTYAQYRFAIFPNIQNGLNLKAFNLTSGPYVDELSWDGTSQTAIVIIRGLSAGISINLKFQMVAYEGDTVPTEWTPYSNICPISGWTGANVTRTGKNLWDEETESGAISASMGTPSANSEFTRSKNFCPIKPSLTYFRGAGMVGDCALFFYRKDKSYIGVKYLGTAQTFDAPADAYFFKLHFSGTVYNNNISVNYPATDTSYHAYSGATYSITFPSEAGEIGGGTLDVTTGKLTVDRMIVDLGMLPCSRISTNVSGVYRFIFNGVTGLKWSASLSSKANLLCSQYPTETVNGTYLGRTGIAASADADNVYVFDSTRATLSAEDFSAAMSGTKLCYELATPIVYDLTPAEVRTLLAQNNIWADCGDSTVEYRADTKLYIDKKIAALAAAMN